MFEKLSAWLRERKQRRQWNSWSDYWLKRMLFENQDLELRSLRTAQKQFREVMKVQKRFKKSRGQNDYIV